MGLGKSALHSCKSETGRLHKVSHERKLGNGWKHADYTERFENADVYAPQDERVELEAVTEERLSGRMWTEFTAGSGSL